MPHYPFEQMKKGCILVLTYVRKEDSPLGEALAEGGYPAEFFSSPRHLPWPVTPDKHQALIVDYRLYANWEGEFPETLPVILYIAGPSELPAGLAGPGRFSGLLCGRPGPAELDGTIGRCRSSWLENHRRDMALLRMPLLKEYLLQLKGNCDRISEYLDALHLTPNRIGRLTLGEFNLFKVMGLGEGKRQGWARAMDISESTLGKHLQSLRRKLAVNSTESLIDLSVSFFKDFPGDGLSLADHLAFIKTNITILYFLTEWHSADLLRDMTNRECDVILGLLNNRTNGEIAEDLCISVHTVKSHVSRIYKKLGVTSRTQLQTRFRGTI